MHYLKFKIPYDWIKSVLYNGKFSNLIFHIDLSSIARGFYNKDVIHYEINNYIQTHKMPKIFFEEAKEFYGKLYEEFSQFNPKFITFYDKGKNTQNKTIDKSYKGERGNAADNLLLDNEEEKLFYAIKDYYYEEFSKLFQINNSHVFYLKDYETDLVPYYLISKNICNFLNGNILHVILSTDKDLLQTCQFKNVIQAITNYSKKEGKLLFNVFDDENAISYIWKKFKKGWLTSKYIPLVLALGGDKSDNIEGLPGIGPSSACKLIIQHQIPHIINEQTQLPEKLNDYKKKIIHNLKLISFEEQIKRLPYYIKQELDSLNI